jgi:prophage regulatory protein
LLNVLVKLSSKEKEMKTKQSIIRLGRVQEITSLGRSTLYALIAEGAFPMQVKISCRCVGWIESEVLDWISRRIEESRGGAE